MNSRFSRRALLVLLVAALAATAARLAAPTEAHLTKPSRALICGSERWRVKTLQDRPKLYSAKPKPVAWLMGLTRPKPAPKARSNFERHIYSVESAVTDVLSEGDQDLHLVLRDGPAHMVAESPNAPFCSVDATAYRKKQMAKAREGFGSAHTQGSWASSSGTGRTTSPAGRRTRSSSTRFSTSPASRAEAIGTGRDSK
jgi:hypothetical protein